MQTVVVALLHQIKEITGRDGHGVGEQFDGDAAAGRFRGLAWFNHRAALEEDLPVAAKHMFIMGRENEQI